MNFKRLEDMIRESGISQKDFCKNIGVTPQGFRKMINKNYISVDLLEKISIKLQVSPCVFFDDYAPDRYPEKHITPQGVNEDTQTYNQIENLRNELKLKDDLIRTYHQLLNTRKL